MGYHAYGGGSFILKDPELAAELDLDKLNDISSCRFSVDGDELVAEVMDGCNYWSDQYDEVMGIIEPFVEEGEVELIGDDNERWRFICRDGKIVCESAEYYYPGEADSIWKRHYGDFIGSISALTHGKQQYFIQDNDRIYSRVSDKYLSAAEVLREYLFELQNMLEV